VRLGSLFRAIVIGLSPACESNAIGPADAAPDATNDVTTTDATDASADVAIDSYVDWCEAGPPWLVGGDGCNTYEYVPCGLPPGDVVDDAGVIGRCDQICFGAPDDQCAEAPAEWYASLIDAGDLDADALTEGGVLVLCACVGSSGRRFRGFRDRPARGATRVGAYLARAARLEAASVHAFARLAEETRALGAPRALVDRIARAARDEARHAVLVARAARSFGGRVARVGPPAKTRARSVADIARENAREGCVRETFGALVATWQARHARADLRGVMTVIARDETRHAELAFEVASLLDANLDPRARESTRRAMLRARRDLAREIAQRAPREIRETLGLPSPDVARAMLARLDAALFRAQRHTHVVHSTGGGSP